MEDLFPFFQNNESLSKGIQHSLTVQRIHFHIVQGHPSLLDQLKAAVSSLMEYINPSENTME